MEISSGFEYRFLLDRARAAAVRKAAAPHLVEEIRDPARPVAYTSTVYFDSSGGRFLRSFDSGTATRLRLRQYAAARDLDQRPRAVPGVWIELKESAGAERRKVRLELPWGVAARLVRGRCDRTVLSHLDAAPALAAVGEDLRCGVLRPQVMTWYRRVSLVGGGLRVTFDEAIAYCSPAAPRRQGEAAEPSRVLAREGGTMLEVKLAGAVPDWLERALRGARSCPGHSKFRSAMAARERQRRVHEQGATLPLPALG